MDTPIECIPPIVKSPLDSKRGRGKHRKTKPSAVDPRRDSTGSNFSISLPSIIVIYNKTDSPHVVGIGHAK